jgi:hypothetical protein
VKRPSRKRHIAYCSKYIQYNLLSGMKDSNVQQGLKHKQLNVPVDIVDELLEGQDSLISESGQVTGKKRQCTVRDMTVRRKVATGHTISRNRYQVSASCYPGHCP